MKQLKVLLFNGSSFFCFVGFVLPEKYSICIRKTSVGTPLEITPFLYIASRTLQSCEENSSMILTTFSNINRAFDMRNNDEKITGTTVEKLYSGFFVF